MSVISPQRSKVLTHDQLVALPAVIPLGDGLVLEARPRPADRLDPRGIGWLVGWRADALMAAEDPEQTIKRARRLLAERYPGCGGSALIQPTPAEDDDR